MTFLIVLNFPKKKNTKYLIIIQNNGLTKFKITLKVT